MVVTAVVLFLEGRTCVGVRMVLLMRMKRDKSSTSISAEDGGGAAIGNSLYVIISESQQTEK